MVWVMKCIPKTIWPKIEFSWVMWENLKEDTIIPIKNLFLWNNHIISIALELIIIFFRWTILLLFFFFQFKELFCYLTYLVHKWTRNPMSNCLNPKVKDKFNIISILSNSLSRPSTFWGGRHKTLISNLTIQTFMHTYFDCLILNS